MEKFTITTPIYYANGKPHIGHAYTTVAADVLARLYKQEGKEVFFLTGTDEHGAKVAETAAVAGKEPQEFVDEIAAEFKQAWKELDIEYSDFIRTTETRHEQGVVHALNKLKEAGVVYEKTYRGLYCTGCEAFVTEKELDENGLEPLHQKKPVVVEEKNWFFRLSDFLPQIKKSIKDGNIKIYPEERRNEVLGLLEHGLEDFSISRSRDRLKWGIPLPFDEEQTAYVWVDALLNYVTALGYGSSDEERLKKFWPADVQIMGQDILKFHAIYWPAILLALGLDLPKSLLIHGYFTISGQKMSKSLGNVINPLEIKAQYGTDITRFFLLSAFPFGNSGDIDVKNFEEKYNDLANTLGNLVRRSFNLAEKYGVGLDESELGQNWDDEQEGHPYLNDIRNIQNVLEAARLIDKEFSKSAPWQEKDEAVRDAAIKKTLGGISKLSKLIAPVMPRIAEQITESFKQGKVVNPPVLFPKKV